jgi:hypothetical protein
MDQDTFTKLVATLHQLTGSAGGFAEFIIMPLMLGGIIFGFWLSRWIFLGGLSRPVFPIKGYDDPIA